MFQQPFNYPRQDYGVNPRPKVNAAQRPRDIDDAIYLKRRLAQEQGVAATNASATQLQQRAASESTATQSVCHMDSRRADGVLDSLLEDMDGNAIHVDSCDVIYDDGGREVRLLIADDGEVVVDYVDESTSFWHHDQKESPITSAGPAESVPVTLRPPASRFLAPSVPASTTVTDATVGSVITVPPRLRATGIE